MCHWIKLMDKAKLLMDAGIVQEIRCPSLHSCAGSTGHSIHGQCLVAQLLVSSSLWSQSLAVSPYHGWTDSLCPKSVYHLPGQCLCQLLFQKLALHMTGTVSHESTGLPGFAEPEVPDQWHELPSRLSLHHGGLPSRHIRPSIFGSKVLSWRPLALGPHQFAASGTLCQVTLFCPKWFSNMSALF